METTVIGIVVALVVFALLNLMIAARAKPVDAADFHIKQRKVGALAVAAATFTLLGGGEFVSVTALSYAFGSYASLYFGGIVLGFVIFAALIARARQSVVSKDMHSLPDYFGAMFGRLPAATCSFMSMIALGALLVIQFIVGGQLISAFVGAPPWIVIVFMSVIVLAYVFISGYKGVLASDLVQGFVMIVAVAILATYLGLGDKANLPPSSTHSPPPLPDGLGLVILGLGAVVGGSDVWQRVLSAKDDKAASRGLIINCVGWAVFGAFFIWLAIEIQRVLPQHDPNTAFVTFLSSGLPVWLAPLPALLVFVAVVSTAEVELFLLSVVVNKELGRYNRTNLTISSTRWLMLAVAVLAAVFAIVIKVPVELYFALLYILSAQGAVTLARLLGRGNTLTALLGMVGGLTAIVVLYASGKMTDWYPFLIVAPAVPAYLVKARDAGVPQT